MTAPCPFCGAPWARPACDRVCVAARNLKAVTLDPEGQPVVMDEYGTPGPKGGRS